MILYWPKLSIFVELTGITPDKVSFTDWFCNDEHSVYTRARIINFLWVGRLSRLNLIKFVVKLENSMTFWLNKDIELNIVPDVDYVIEL